MRTAAGPKGAPKKMDPEWEAKLDPLMKQFQDLTRRLPADPPAGVPEQQPVQQRHLAVVGLRMPIPVALPALPLARLPDTTSVGHNSPD